MARLHGLRRNLAWRWCVLPGRRRVLPGLRWSLAGRRRVLAWCGGLPRRRRERRSRIRGERWRHACGRFLGFVVDIHAERGGDSGQPVVVALADGADLPAVAAPVDLHAHHGGLGAQPAHGESQCARIGSDGRRQRADTGEGGRTAAVQARGHDHLVHIAGQRAGLDIHHIARAAPVHIGDSGRDGLIEEDEVGIRAHAPVGPQQQRRDIHRRRAGDRHRQSLRGRRPILAPGKRTHDSPPPLTSLSRSRVCRAGGGCARPGLPRIHSTTPVPAPRAVWVRTSVRRTRRGRRRRTAGTPARPSGRPPSRPRGRG